MLDSPDKPMRIMTGREALHSAGGFQRALEVLQSGPQLF